MRTCITDPSFALFAENSGSATAMNGSPAQRKGRGLTPSSAKIEEVFIQLDYDNKSHDIDSEFHTTIATTAADGDDASSSPASLPAKGNMQMHNDVTDHAQGGDSQSASETEEERERPSRLKARVKKLSVSLNQPPLHVWESADRKTKAQVVAAAAAAARVSSGDKGKQIPLDKAEATPLARSANSSPKRRTPGGGGRRSVLPSPRYLTPSMRSGFTTPSGAGRAAAAAAAAAAFQVDPMVLEAWDALRVSQVLFRGRPVGTIAALDPSETALNYDQVFVRDFVPSALAFLMNGEAEIVENFLLKTLRLQQSWEKRVDVFTLGEGVMPASFKVLHDSRRGVDTMMADFGESAIGRVAPVDSGFWWIILLRAYVKATESIPDWLFDFMPLKGGYFIGNVSPARMDFRWFALGNCMAIVSCMASPEQAAAIMDLIEERWDELVGEMPLKIAYPALENHDWRITTGCDPKNTRWSYHNGGSWPVLIWMLSAASIKVGRPHVARKAIEVIEKRLAKDGWPEYYDGKLGRYVGKQARKQQTWSVAGYLVAKMMLEDPSHLGIISLEEEKKLQQPALTRSRSWKV
ncbi:unnamed protein product [Closterium sp. NIES-54]